MNKLLTFILLTISVSCFGQIDNNQKLIDSLKYVTDMPYICEEVGSIGCGDNFFWEVVKQKQTIIPLLLHLLDDTTETKATVPNFGGQYTVGDICYSALQEIIHGIPTFDIAGIKFDSNGCGYCSFWNYIRQPNNRIIFKTKITKWYNDCKQKLIWVINDKYEICDCSSKHPNAGHYELKK